MFGGVRFQDVIGEGGRMIRFLGHRPADGHSFSF